MSRPELHIVAATPTPKPTQSPEATLRRLFRREARLEAELLEARRELAAARVRYARKHLLLVLPGIDHLRRMFS